MKKNDNNRLEYDKVNFDDEEKITSVNTSDIDNDGVNPDDIKEYVLNDDAIDDDEKDKEKDEDKKKEELKKRILMGIIGAGIIIAILLLAFGLRKNKVAAVLSNDAQDRMINDLSGYIHEVAADKIDENTSKQIATDVIEDNFKDLLIQNFMSLSEEQVTQMIKQSLDKYMSNYYTKEEMDEINNNIVNNFMTTIADVRSDIDKIREDIANLVKDYEHYKEVTDANLKDLQDQIDVINSEIDITEVETPLISYVWNVNIKKPTKPSKEVETDEDGNVISSGTSTVDDTGKETSDTSTSADGTTTEGSEITGDTDNGTGAWAKWEDPEEGVKWHIVKKEHDTSDMTIKEYVEILAGNDIEFTKSLNELYEYLNDLYAQEKSDRENDIAKERADREDSDMNITNFFNTKVSDLQEQIDTINNQLGGYSIWTGTQAEYNALGHKDGSTIYLITE